MGFSELDSVPVVCPFCKTEQTQDPFKTWKYGEGIKVYRFLCGCEKTFNFYLGPSNYWTVPKKVKK